MLKMETPIFKFIKKNLKKTVKTCKKKGDLHKLCHIHYDLCYTNIIDCLCCKNI